MVIPMHDRVDGAPHPRVDRTPLVIASVAAVGLVAGLLATGGGIVLVPLFIVAFGFTTARAAGTSLVVAAALTVPTLATHWLLGNIDWSIAAAFALGMVPASFVAARRRARPCPTASSARRSAPSSSRSRSTSWRLSSPDRG